MVPDIKSFNVSYDFRGEGFQAALAKLLSLTGNRGQYGPGGELWDLTLTGHGRCCLPWVTSPQLWLGFPVKVLRRWPLHGDSALEKLSQPDTDLEWPQVHREIREH